MNKPADSSTRQPVACPECGATLPPFTGQAGQVASCFMCGHEFVIPRQAEATPAAYGPGSEAADELDAYELEPPHVVSRPSPYEIAHPAQGRDQGEAESRARERLSALARAAAEERAARPVNEEAERTERLHAIRHAPDPDPEHPFVSGVFDFPIRAGVWPRMLAMSVGTAAAAASVYMMLDLCRLLPGSEEGASRSMISGVLLVTPCIWAALFVGAYESACLLSVVVDTANGCDQIQEWPESDWRGWVYTLRFPLLAGAIGLLVAGLVAELTGEWTIISLFAAFLVFPIAVLSMLEHETGWVPLSLPILKSLVRSWRAWLLFYGETALVWVAVVFIGWIATLALPSVLAYPLAAVGATAGLLIYSRLLGRLGWYQARALAEEEEEEESDDE